MQDITKPSNMKELIPITENDAIRMQWNLIRDWKQRSDVWPFTYGIGALAGSSAISGSYMNSFYRKVLCLGQYGLRTSFLPAAILPTLCTTVMHTTMISSDILIGKTHCSVCVWIRATALQLAMGVVYPLTITPLASFYMASTYYTYRVPKITDTTQLLKFWWTITKPKFGHLYILTILQTILVSIITQQELQSIQRINAKLDSDEFNQFPPYYTSK